MSFKTITIELRDLAQDSYLRNDVKFHYFLYSSNWNLFNSQNKLIKLKDILEDDYNLFKYKDGEEYKGIPTGQTYIDEDGEIIDYQIVTKNDHPGRLKYRISDENILISSLRLAKSPALLFENKNLSNYIFSNGYYIFKINKNWNKKFILYLLRTKRLKSILDNHIYRGIGISAYKKEDLLKIKIPLIPKSAQDQIVAQIEPIEQEIKNLKSQIKDPKEIINQVFARELGFDLEKFKEAKKEKFFKVEFFFLAKDDDLKLNVSSTKFVKNNFKIAGVRYYKIKDVSKDIFAGGDMPKDYSNEKDEIYKYPIFSNGKQRLGLIGYTTEARVKEKAVTISARGTIGFAVTREEPYFPIVRLISIIPDENKILCKYLEHIINFLDIEKSGNTIAQLTTPMVEKIKIPLPDIPRQQKIVNEIKTKLDKQEEIKKKIEKLRNKIDKIIERSIK
ncbi:restriction endonuclease subunit S [Desulfonauticus submarinus]